jgi:hypothetical protein
MGKPNGPSVVGLSIIVTELGSQTNEWTQAAYSGSEITNTKRKYSNCMPIFVTAVLPFIASTDQRLVWFYQAQPIVQDALSWFIIR